jgi:hypothetical protein
MTISAGIAQADFIPYHAVKFATISKLGPALLPNVPPMRHRSSDYFETNS